METRSWPPVGRSHWPHSAWGKLFGGKLSDWDLSFACAGEWEKKFLPLQVEKDKLNSRRPIELMWYIVEYSEMYMSCVVESGIEIVAGIQNGDNGKETGVDILESGCDFKGKCELF